MMNCVIDKYNKLGRIPCSKCGLDCIAKTRIAKQYVIKIYAKGMVIKMETCIKYGQKSKAKQ